MQQAHELDALQRDVPTVLTIGTFDGVHRGHQYLILQVVERARSLGAQSMVLTFDPAPQVVLRPGSLQLTDAGEKARLIGALGVEVLTVLSFTPELSQVAAPQFLEALLDHVNVAEFWAGADFAFGHKRQGNIDLLIGAGQYSNFAVHVVARQKLDGHAVSSSAVRDLLVAGDVEQAAVLLGHFPGISGEVVTGHGRGTGLGYPTANLQPPPHQLLPATGIYAGFLRHESRRLPAAISVGYNPVFEGKDIRVEAFVLDYSGELHGARVGLDFVGRIREERNFAGVDDLIAEMGRDVERARQILEAAQEPGELMLHP